MAHTPLIATLVVGLVLAFIMGAVVQRLRVSPIVGYLLAGVVVGPFTPGFVADQALANELAEIGVILLMFGVGLHFSLRDLLSVWTIAIPGALAQMAFAILLSFGLTWILSWPSSAGFVFGLALSVASTVVLMRFLQERRLIQTSRGHIAVGWLIVQDLAMILALVLLPVMAEVIGPAGGQSPAGPPTTADVLHALAITFGKVAAFIVGMLIVGRRVIPLILHYIAHTGSRELFRLAVLSIALGVAYGGAVLFGVSFALGAFFAGMILSESELSQRAAEESLPLRDAFAVLFFVSIGMLFDPTIILRDPWALIATVLIVVVGKSAAAFLVVRAFGHGNGTALMIAASLAQIGEFSFILASLAVALQLLTEEARDLILAGAILSILLNSGLVAVAERLRQPLDRQPAPADPAVAPAPAADPPSETSLVDHAVLVGFGRVGRVIAHELGGRGVPFLVVDDQQEVADRADGAGYETIVGNAAEAAILKAARIARARWLFVAVPNGFEAGQIVAQAKAMNPQIEVVARAHSDAEVEHLHRFGADSIIMGEREIALGMFGMVFPRPEAGETPGTAAPSPGPAPA
ncbi:MAG: YbaL family putative K(+) efflux transporter [Alphaproteobacteria bacterium]